MEADLILAHTIEHRPRIGVELRSPGDVASLDVDGFRPLRGAAHIGHVPLGEADGEALLRTLERRPEVGRAWIERPPAPPPWLDAAPWADGTESEGHLDPAPEGLGFEEAHRKRPGSKGGSVHIAIVERAWGTLGRDLATSSEPLGCHPETAWGHHGDRTLSVLRGTEQGVVGMVPEGSLHLVSALAQQGDAWVDRVPEAMERGLALLEQQMPQGGGILLVQMQTFLMLEQVCHLGLHRTEHAPGGRACLGPIEVDPAVRAVMARAVEAGHTVVLPTGNGRLPQTERAWEEVGMRPMGQLPRIGLRVAGAVGGRPLAASNRGRWVDLYAPAERICSATSDGDASAGWRLAPFGGTSAAAAIVAAAAAAIQGVRIADGQRPLPPEALRARLLHEATPVTEHGATVGWMPNLMASEG